MMENSTQMDIKIIDSNMVIIRGALEDVIEVEVDGTVMVTIVLCVIKIGHSALACYHPSTSNM